MIAGDVGAVVGSVTGSKKTKKAFVNTLRVRITVNDLTAPTAYVQLISRQTKTNTAFCQNAYRFAYDILSVLSIIINGNTQDTAQQQCGSSQILDVSEEIRKFKQLLDEGIISQEEFDTKKKQLLES
ncbi:SHOCT domain-containing protein [Clostridium sp. CCUG 7971]|nr:SHOCT domain-containing protein [Clostridium sp. CCUG 7971]